MSNISSDKMDTVVTKSRRSLESGTFNKVIPTGPNKGESITFIKTPQKHAYFNVQKQKADLEEST